jgi:hypothetical protein
MPGFQVVVRLGSSRPALLVVPELPDPPLLEVLLAMEPVLAPELELP